MKCKRIAILTNFTEFNSGYSLTSIVRNQCLMLHKYGHQVSVFVSEKFNGKDVVYNYAEVIPSVPQEALVDYREQGLLSADHAVFVKKLESWLLATLKEFDFIITHDWIFTGWNLPYALAMQNVSREIKGPKWGHWVHSIPSALQDWWSIREYGPGHKIIFPNKTMRTQVAEQFRGHVKDVRIIPHIVDMRVLHNFSSETIKFIEDHPGLMQADIVQIYPASTDRLRAKKIREVMLIMKYFKAMGLSVCFVCANQWATGRGNKEDLEKYKKIASRNGLELDKEMIFTSDWQDGKYATGLPQEMLVELYHCANLFIYPTQEESFGLVAPEIALTGGALLVLNKSLDMMFEVNGWCGLYVDFGSFESVHNPPNEANYFESVAYLIVGRMMENESINSKTFHRQKHNMDFIYNRYYRTMFEESITWG